MNNSQFSSPSEARFARRLREAARGEQPQFSESLHARIMQAVRSPAAQTPTLQREFGSGRFLRRIYLRNAAWLVAAAAVVATVILAGSHLGSAGGGDRLSQRVPAQNSNVARSDPTSLPPKSVVPSASVGDSSVSDDSLADDEANQLVDSISSSVAIYSLNDLGRDARTTAHLLVDELPFGSADEWGL